MECQEARDLLGAYADNELGLAEAARLNRHLQSCAACRAELAALHALGRTLRAHVAYHRAPPALRARITATLPSPQTQPLRGEARQASGWGLAAWATAGTGAVAVGALALAAALWLQRPAPPPTSPMQEIVASHVRALLSGHPIDVVSTDQHTVKPWFNGRLDYAPPVLDLTAQGFALAGGRVDYVGGRQVAVLTYHYRKHPIDLYVLPADVASTSTPSQQQAGYALASWPAGSMRCWAITDAAPDALHAFTQAWRMQWQETRQE